MYGYIYIYIYTYIYTYRNIQDISDTSSHFSRTLANVVKHSSSNGASTLGDNARARAASGSHPMPVAGGCPPRVATMTVAARPARATRNHIHNTTCTNIAMVKLNAKRNVCATSSMAMRYLHCHVAQTSKSTRHLETSNFECGSLL